MPKKNTRGYRLEATGKVGTDTPNYGYGEVYTPAWKIMQGYMSNGANDGVSQFQKSMSEAAKKKEDERYRFKLANYDKLSAEGKAEVDNEYMRRAVEKEIEEGRIHYSNGAFPGDAYLPTRFTKWNRYNQMLYAPTLQDAYRYTDDARSRKSWLDAFADNVGWPLLDLSLGQHPEIYEGTGITRVDSQGNYYRYPSFGKPSEVVTDENGDPAYDENGTLQVSHPWYSNAFDNLVNAAVLSEMGIGAAKKVAQWSPRFFNWIGEGAGAGVMPELARRYGVNTARGFRNSYGATPAAPAVAEAAETTEIDKMSDAELGKAFENAYKNKDTDTAQNLWNYWFTKKAVDNKLVDANGNPINLFHNTHKNFNAFDMSRVGSANDPGFYGSGIYTTPTESYASTYGPIKMKLYGYMNSPFSTEGDMTRSAQAYNFNRMSATPLVELPEHVKAELSAADGVIQTGPSYLRGGQPIEEVVFSDPKRLKFSDPFTFDDEGNLIPLLERANFEKNDSRFSSGGSIHIKPENRGKFTALKERTGHSATWFKEHGTPAQKKMATFALNARKWNHADGGYLRNLSRPLKKFDDPVVEGQFRKWYDEIAKARGWNPDPNTQDYDIRRYWIENKDMYSDVDNWSLPVDSHFPDKYKLPGHPAMSVESMYQPVNERGYVWNRASAPEGYEEYRRPETDAEWSNRRATAKFMAGGGKKNSPDYTGIINSRVKSAYSALRRNGYGVEDAWRLAGLMTAHSISETGWINPSSNNFGGHKSGSVLRYSSPEAFWDYHISNLNEKWPGWDRATTPEEYDEAINHTSLGLYTSDKYDAYKKTHPNTYIYAPAWENDNYLGNMKSI